MGIRKAGTAPHDRKAVLLRQFGPAGILTLKTRRGKPLQGRGRSEVKRIFAGERGKAAKSTALGRLYDKFEGVFSHAQRTRDKSRMKRLMNYAEKIGVKKPLKSLVRSRKGMAWIMDRGLRDYDETLKAGFKGLVEEMLKKRKKVRVLDIGPGRGEFLGGLKWYFGSRVETTGMYLTMPEGEYRKGVDRRIIGSIDLKNPQKKPNEKYDIITSIMGTRYARVHSIAVQRACNSLATGGVALLHIPGAPAEKNKYGGLLERLNSSGLFRAEVFESKAEKHYEKPLGILCLKVERLKSGSIDLSPQVMADWKKIGWRLAPTARGFPKTKPEEPVHEKR